MTTIDRSVVPGASYVVYEGGPTEDSPITVVPPGASFDSMAATFYTFDGIPITTINHRFQFDNVTCKLDKTAPKPKPVSYKRAYWASPGLETKVDPGFVILFHDKNGNRIGWNRMNAPDQDVTSFTKYDVSGATEEPPDFTGVENSKSYRLCIIC